MNLSPMISAFNRKDLSEDLDSKKKKLTKFQNEVPPPNAMAIA